MQHTNLIYIRSTLVPPDPAWDAEWQKIKPAWAVYTPHPIDIRRVMCADKAREIAALMASLPGWDEFAPPYTFMPLVWRETIEEGARWWSYGFEVGVSLSDISGPYTLGYLPSEKVKPPVLGDLVDDVEPGTRLEFDTLAEAQRAVYALHTHAKASDFI